MFKKLIALILILNCFAISLAGASDSGVVINAFRIAGESSTDEYVEILNTTSSDIDLSGWRLSKKTASGNSSNLVTSFPAIFIEPGSTLVIAHGNFHSGADIKYSTSNSVADDNTILLSNNQRIVVDRVGFGLASDYEGEPVVNPNKFEVYGRKDGIDTDNNKNDFSLIYAPPKPKEKPPSLVESKPTPSNTSAKESGHREAKLIVTEFLPNPEGSDSENEFIEIRNNGEKADIGGYYIADTIGSPKMYKIQGGTTIGPGDYLVFYSAKIPISLNNKGDGVEVLDPNKKAIDGSPDDCGKAPEGMSYALSDKGWVWTKTPTPGKPNIIDAPTGEEIGVKGSSKEVISMDSLDSYSDPKEETPLSLANSSTEKYLGFGLLAMAILGAISYTLYNNKERIIEIYHKFRSRNDRPGEAIRQKIKGR